VLSRAELVPQEAVEEAGALHEACISEQDVKFGLTMLESRAGLLCVPYLDLPTGTIVRVRIRARDVMVANAPPVGLSALNVFPGKVIELRKSGEAAVEVDINCNGVRVSARLTRKSVETLGLAVEMSVYAILKGVTMDKSTLARSPVSANLRGTDLGVRHQNELSSADR